MRSQAIVVAVLLSALSGCYEYEEVPATAQAPAPAAEPAPADEAAYGQADARPSHAGARQAAHNTVDKIGERQQELEKALEDQ